MKIMYLMTYSWFIVISGFRRDVDEICTLLGYYAASSGNPLPTFRENISVPSSKVKKSKKKRKPALPAFFSFFDTA
jgi:hypothetical protein